MRLRNISGSREQVAESRFVVQEPECHKGAWKEFFGNAGFRQLNHQQMLANRRNAVFFCQILSFYMLHVLHVYGIMVLR